MGDYLYTDEWEFTGSNGCKWTTGLETTAGSTTPTSLSSRPWIRLFRLPTVLSMDGTTSMLENTTTTERGPGLSPTTSRTETSSLERSLLKTNLCWMVRDSATSSLTPGQPLTPWSGSAGPSDVLSPSPGTLLARMS